LAFISGSIKNLKNPPKKFEEPLLVTRPVLPPLEKYCQGLREIWDNNWLTNSGPVHKRFQARLGEFFRADNVSLFANGTLALQLGLQAMKLPAGSEVITTPFTFVATAHAIKAAGLEPVFCDISPENYNLDPAKVAVAITPRTSAIVAVHVFGHPCDVHALEDIANKHNLKLIFDAAHAFGVEIDGKPISDFGDMSMFSLHATKVFHSVEGGALVCKDRGVRTLTDQLKNFGMEGETQIGMIGSNAKMSELHALMGLELMEQFGEIIDNRRRIVEIYRQGLADILGVVVPKAMPENVSANYAYFSIEIDAERFGMSRDEFCQKLKEYNVFARRYFYPLLTDFACYANSIKADDLTIAKQVADRILCLPIYSDMLPDDAEKLCGIISAIKVGD